MTTDVSLPERLADAEGELPARLRIIADGDLRTMARDSLVGIHPDQHELHEWADLMDEAADALTAAADSSPASEPVTDLDHAQYDRDGWMESALRAQEAVAELQARLTAAESAREALKAEIRDQAMRQLASDAGWELENDKLRAERDEARAELHEALHGEEAEGVLQGLKIIAGARDAAEAALSAALARAERAEKNLAGWKRVAVVAALPLEAMRMAGSYRALAPSTQACVDEAVVTIRMAVAGHSLPPEGDMDAALAPARAALAPPATAEET